MLSFFRRYQKFFYAVITIVIVISFSFFGTYNVFVKGEKKDIAAFKTIDGREVNQVEYNDLVHFLSADCIDTLYKGQINGSFNDGFIANDMLQTGVFVEIATPYLKEISSDLDIKFEREKHYQPYTHPQAPFISVEQLWTYYAPELKTSFHEFQSLESINSKQALQTRVKLYLCDRMFPAAYAKQMLRFQERQFSWIEPDRDLAQKDLSLFNYHTFQDWFGKKSLDLIAQYVLNVASIAKKKGFTVSDQYVQKTLVNSLQRCYTEAKRDPNFRCPNVGVFEDQALQSLGMDRARLEKAVEVVLLYRAYMQTFQSAPLICPDAFNEFQKFLDGSIEADVYRLPQELSLKTLDDLEKLEIYLTAIGEKREYGLPTKLYSVAAVKKSYPELVGKHYKLVFTHADSNALACKIGVRKTWEWQGEDANWKKLQDKFAEVKQIVATTPEERQNKLYGLNPETRALIDEYSRAQIVNEHPEWLSDTLKQSKPQEVEVYVRERGGDLPFEGIDNTIEFMRLLDAVPLDTDNSALCTYSQDKKNYYSIKVLEKEPARIFTLREALADGTLDDLLNKALEATYVKIRASKPALYAKGKDGYKPLAEVKDSVAEAHFENFFQQLDREVRAVRRSNPSYTNFEDVKGARVACRLYPYVAMIREKLQEKGDVASKYIVDVEAVGTSDTLRQQFCLIHSKEKTSRKVGSAAFDVKDAFATADNAFSKVDHMPQGTISFVRVLIKTDSSTNGDLNKKIYEAKGNLGNEIECTLAGKLIVEFKNKKAIRLSGESND